MITKDYLYLNHANDYAQSVGAEAYHPMVSVVHFDELGPIAHTLNKMGDVYAFFVQDNFPEGGKYGMGDYDTSKGIDQGDRSLIFYFERGRDSGVKATSVFSSG